jgi:hypothetical protein
MMSSWDDGDTDMYDLASDLGGAVPGNGAVVGLPWSAVGDSDEGLSGTSTGLTRRGDAEEIGGAVFGFGAAVDLMWSVVHMWNVVDVSVWCVSDDSLVSRCDAEASGEAAIGDGAAVGHPWSVVEDSVEGFSGMSSVIHWSCTGPTRRCDAEDSSDDAHGGAGVVGDGGVAAAPEFVMAVKPDSELDSFLLELGLRVEPTICAHLFGNAPLEGVDLDIDFSLRQIYSSDARCLAPVSHFRLFEVFAYGWLRVKIQDEAGVQVRRRIRQWVMRRKPAWARMCAEMALHRATTRAELAAEETEWERHRSCREAEEAERRNQWRSAPPHLPLCWDSDSY